jgi:hypothetical protein
VYLGYTPTGYTCTTIWVLFTLFVELYNWILSRFCVLTNLKNHIITAQDDKCIIYFTYYISVLLKYYWLIISSYTRVVYYYNQLRGLIYNRYYYFKIYLNLHKYFVEHLSWVFFFNCYIVQSFINYNLCISQAYKIRRKTTKHLSSLNIKNIVHYRLFYSSRLRSIFER